MTMRSFYKFSGIVLAVTVLVSCARKNDIIEPVALPPGGEGGDITLNITPQHRKKNISDGTVYIWYARTELPADLTSFDDSMDLSIDLGRPAATFKNLTQGDYFVYAKGTDFELEPGNDEVKGSSHFRVIDTLQRTYDLYLQVEDE